jgi:Family of unknown function (DUF5989)
MLKAAIPMGIRTMDKTPGNDFERISADQPSLVREFVEFLGQNKKWWMLPILFVMLLLGLLIFLSSTAVAPFIYTLF